MRLAPSRANPPRRVANAERRPREYLTEAEVDQLCKAARKRGRYGARDATMILVAFRHGLRVGELVALRWDQIDFDSGLMHVNRLKSGVASVHPISGRELRGLLALKREEPVGSRVVFVTERGGPFTPNGFHKMLSRIGAEAGMPFAVHPHMLRHACGFRLANAGHDTRALQHYLGHRQIQHTVRYTEMAPGRFNGFWKDRAAPGNARRGGERAFSIFVCARRVLWRALRSRAIEVPQTALGAERRASCRAG